MFSLGCTYVHLSCQQLLPEKRVELLPRVEIDDELPALLPPSGEDPLHHLPQALPRQGGQDGRGLVRQDQPSRRIGR